LATFCLVVTMAVAVFVAHDAKLKGPGNDDLALVHFAGFLVLRGSTVEPDLRAGSRILERARRSRSTLIPKGAGRRSGVHPCSRPHSALI